MSSSQSSSAKRAKKKKKDGPQYWLVKLPDDVAERWKKRVAEDRQAEEDAMRGKPAQQQKKKRKLGVISVASLTNVTLEVEGSDGEPPKTLQLEGVSQRQLPHELVVFSEHKECKVEHRVTASFVSAVDVKSKGYIESLKARFQQQAKKPKMRRLTQEESDERRRGRLDDIHQDAAEREKNKKSSEYRIAHAYDPNTLEYNLLELFKSRPMYTLTELLDRTRTQRAKLKAALDVLCVYHNKGEFIHNYELRPEYRDGDDGGDGDEDQDDLMDEDD